MELELEEKVRKSFYQDYKSGGLSRIHRKSTKNCFITKFKFTLN